jgi:hypothetical protein
MGGMKKLIATLGKTIEHQHSQLENIVLKDCDDQADLDSDSDSDSNNSDVIEE